MQFSLCSLIALLSGKPTRRPQWGQSMSQNFNFSIKSVPFNEDYLPSENTRITTNFANLARGDSRRENLCNTLQMIDNRFNALAQWDNPKGDRYSVELDIISVTLGISGDAAGDKFRVIVGTNMRRNATQDEEIRGTSITSTAFSRN